MHKVGRMDLTVYLRYLISCMTALLVLYFTVDKEEHAFDL